MKLIRIFAIATVLVTAAMGQSDKGGSQAKATPTPSPAKAASPANAKGQPAAPAAAKATPTPATKSGPATKSSPATKAAPSAVKSGSITPAPGAKTAAAKPASAAPKTLAPGAAPPNTVTKTGAAQANTATKTGVAAPATGTATAGMTKKAATPAAKTTAAASTKKTAAKPAAPKTAAKKNIVPAKPVKASVVPTPPAPPLEKKAPTKLMGSAGRRDPFISPIRSVTTGSPAGNCSSGKRCLAIPELILQGTVRDISGKMMAIVATSNRRTYTLRENDQVFNGSVEKITSDSIIFREFVRDALGRESAREVVKKLSPTT